MSLIVLWLNSGLPMQRAQVRFLVREPDPTCCVVCQGVGSKPTNQPTKQTKSLVKPAVLPAWIPPLCHAVARLQPCPLPSGAPSTRVQCFSLALYSVPLVSPPPASHFSDSFCSKLLVFQNAVPSSSTPLSGTLSNLTPCLPPP